MVGGLLRHRGLTLSLAESCTGGLIASMLTDVPGASSFFHSSAVTYANSAKELLLSVPTSVLERHGAVSAECAEAMARGARTKSGTDVALSVTGIAGPGGGTEQKPVGTVWFGFADKSGSWAVQHRFPGDRDRVRRRTAYVALELLRRNLQGLDIVGFSQTTFRAMVGF